MSQANITPIPYRFDSENYFLKLQSLPYSCWLDSGKPDSANGRYDIMTAMPSHRLVTTGHDTQKIFCHYDLQSVQAESSHSVAEPKEIIEANRGGDPLSLIQEHIDSLSSVAHENIPFIGGAIGYFAYDLGYRYHGIVDEKNLTMSPFANMQVGIYHWALIQDHQLNQSWLVALPECDPRLLSVTKSILTADCPVKVGKFHTGTLNTSLQQQPYLSRLARIKDYILAGDCYQINFSQQFCGRYSGNPYAAYRTLRKTMASPFSAYLRLGKQAILSFSPERFLSVHQNKVLTQPIKGTCKRADHAAVDKQNAISLQQSEKNRAENLMIVDLLRNDLGRQCIPGSIQVEKLFALETFPNVHHLVSTICGALREEATALDLLRDCFPGGSVTGAPKRRAMEIIHELEPVPRGVYCGSIGYINNQGNMDTNIAIRTVACDGETLYCSGGGGIVADSSPIAEYQESIDKIYTILDMLKKGV